MYTYMYNYVASYVDGRGDGRSWYCSVVSQSSNGSCVTGVHNYGIRHDGMGICTSYTATDSYR